MNGVLVKVSEIWLKGKNRTSFLERLMDNIGEIAGIERNKISLARSRIYIDSESTHGLDTVFGIYSYVPVIKTEDDIEVIKNVALQLMQEKREGAQTFAISSRKEYGYRMSSTEINEVVGQMINDHVPGLRVDLDNPDIVVHVEIRNEDVFVYTSKDEKRGPGGLPVGVTGTGLSFLSGGIDSPVAAWLGMKRGLCIDGVYFHSAPYTSAKAQEKVIDLCRVLSRWRGGEMKLYIPAFGEIQKYLTENAPEDYWTILFRRSMRRIAEMIAQGERYSVLISGDNLAQVASQTAENLSVTDAGGKHLMLRPVIGYDKQEIMDKAAVIGTYDISIQPYEDCCSVFTPRSPKTKSRLSDVKRIEKRLDLARHEMDPYSKMEIFSITSKSVSQIR